MSSQITAANDNSSLHWLTEGPVELLATDAPQLIVRLSAWREALGAELGYILDAGTGMIEFSASLDRLEAEFVRDDLIVASKLVLLSRRIQFSNARFADGVLKWFMAAPVYVNGRLAKVIGFGGYDVLNTPISDAHFILLDTCAEWLGQHFLRTVAPDRLLANPANVKLLLSATTEAIIALDRHERVVFMNAPAEQIAGATLAQAYLSPVASVITLQDGVDDLSIPDLAQFCEATGSSVTLECHVCSAKGGASVQVECRILPIKDQAWQDVSSIVLLSDIEKNAELQQQLIWQNSHDQLSGVKNRFELERMISDIFKKSSGSPAVRASLIHLGIDGLEMINNSCGPAGGDELLRRVAAMILERVGPHAESVSRIGGDEFGILLEGADLRRACQFADEIMQGMRNLFVWGGAEIDVSACIGIVPLRRSMPSSEDVLLSSAMALRRAKEGGRGEKVVMRSLKESDYQANDLHTIGMIRRALEEKRVVLLFQKIAPVHSDRNPERHNEIFVRLRSADGNLISPDSFIPVAERNHLMPQLDRAIIQAVAKHMASFPPDDIIAVNISGKTISSAGIIEFIVEQFEKAKLNPKRICFEITETAAIRNEQDAINFARRMREMGCTISLDDFGAGHHNFVLLKNIAPEYVKIDGSFVRQMFLLDFNTQVIRSIVDMAQKVDAKVIAESVEDQKTMDALIEMGVDFVQGWHIHRPEIVEGF